MTNKDRGITKTPETESDLLLDHQYDGIQEYDNPMPRWWVWIFWGSFWFSLAYLFHYWVGNGESLALTYDAEIAAANAVRAKEALKQEVSEESLSQLLGDAQSVERGAAPSRPSASLATRKRGKGGSGRT
jgi:cytochrome c oxidase cbb3-type subunit 3